MTAAASAEREAGTAHVDRRSLFTRDFLLVMAGSAGGWLAHSMAQWAVAPLLVGMGFDASLAGLGLGLVAVTALLARLVVGPRIDRSGGRMPAVGGMLVLTAGGFAYVVATILPAGTTVALLVALVGASLQGFGFGAMTTASFAIVDDVLPAARRGEGLGYFGLVQPIVQGLGAAASFAVMAAAGFTRLYLAIAVIAGITTLAFAAIRARARHTSAARAPLLGVLHLGRPLVIPIIICSTLSFVGGALILAIPLLGLEVGVTNPGIFYLASAVLGVLARLATGRLSDRLGRATVAIPGLLLMSLVIVGLTLTADLGTTAFVVAGAIHGFATAAILPAIQALVLDRSPLDRRGTSSAAMGMAFDIGFGVGSILIGAAAGAASPSSALLVTAVVPLVSVGLLVIDTRRPLRAAA